MTLGVADGARLQGDDVMAVILAGGAGTRLRSVVSDRPTVLAKVNERPFRRTCSTNWSPPVSGGLWSARGISPSRCTPRSVNAGAE